jgi:hypothetical protein
VVVGGVGVVVGEVVGVGVVGIGEVGIVGGRGEVDGRGGVRSVKNNQGGDKMSEFLAKINGFDIAMLLAGFAWGYGVAKSKYYRRREF